MTTVSLHKRKLSFLVIFLIAFLAFTADILDLREELQVLPSPNNCLDDNITAGLTDPFAIKTEPIPVLYFFQLTSPFEVSSFHLQTKTPRAPPLVS